MKEYKICSGTGNELTKEVNKLMQEGRKPQGGIFGFKSLNSNEFVFLQAMIKDE